jgi:hypothetical protein
LFPLVLLTDVHALGTAGVTIGVWRVWSNLTAHSTVASVRTNVQDTTGKDRTQYKDRFDMTNDGLNMDSLTAPAAIRVVSTGIVSEATEISSEIRIERASNLS